jgi:hypothetical protein
MKPGTYGFVLALSMLFSSSSAQQGGEHKAPVHDAQATDLVKLSLQALGGEDVLKAVHSLDVQGITSSQETTFHWVDTWLRGSQMRRVRKDHTGKASDFTADSEKAPIEAKDKDGHSLKMARYDPVSQLLTQMPGAALALSLREHYTLLLAEVPRREQAGDCIEIKRNERDLIDGGVDAVICLDKTTHLPLYSYLSVANLAMPSRNLTERIQYGQFQTIQSVLVPQEVTVTNPVGQRVTYAFTSFTLNPSNPEITNAGGQQ